jgi:glycosyltransferase 2 family protein
VRVPLPHHRWVRIVLLVAVIVTGPLLVWWRGPSWTLVEDAFESVYWKWIVAAIGLNLISVLVRSLAWGTVIGAAMPGARPRYRSIFSAFSVGLFANAALPGRIGELARVAVLNRRLPRQRGLWATLAGTVFAHRVFDVIAVMLLVLYVLATAKIPSWAMTSLVLFGIVALALLTLAFLSARRHGRPVLDELGVVRRLLVMARQGLGVMRSPGPAATALAYQVLGWTFQLLAVYATMRAFNIHEPLAAAGLVLLLMNVATVFPLWPGNIGLLQAAVALPLVSYGIDYAHGFAFGIGLQAIEVSVGVGVGLIFLAREGLSFAMLRHMPPEPPTLKAAPDLPAREPEPVRTTGAAPERARMSL